MLSAAELSRSSGVAASYISRALREPGDDGYKNIGEVTARKLEHGAKKPEGWMDEVPAKGIRLVHSVQETVAQYKIQGDDVEIRQFEVGGGMGAGRLLLDDQPGVIKSWRVDHDWLRLNVRSYSAIENLCIVTGFGPSMRPMFNPGDPLLVDRGVKVVDTDAVFFFRVGDHGFIKALQRIPTATGLVLRAKSKNPDYDPFDIDQKTMDFEVLGKVLTVWKSEQF
ncbi:S24 family peptidase [Hydrogenophaga sp. 2FB]|uniref:S24 family peptidase n=1 Tax=Hydrogenophaga sp. 2FB TaxID=2502187 RepID=UPI00207BA5BF|nr:S24 family peptidase [Hydrogenophaga sp. 2FB]